MHKLIKISTFFPLAFITFGFSVAFINWNISKDYSIKFSGKKAEGTFEGLSGIIQFDANNLAKAKFDVTVDASTIKTGNNLKDKHAKSDKWFDVEKYPSIKFLSQSFIKTNDTFLVKGNLSMHGITKSYDIPFLFTNQTDSALFAGKFIVNRKDFDIGNGFLSEGVGNEFDVELRLLVKK